MCFLFLSSSSFFGLTHPHQPTSTCVFDVLVLRPTTAMSYCTFKVHEVKLDLTCSQVEIEYSFAVLDAKVVDTEPIRAKRSRCYA